MGKEIKEIMDPDKSESSLQLLPYKTRQKLLKKPIKLLRSEKNKKLFKQAQIDKITEYEKQRKTI
jgi:hypothetical protein